MTNKRKRDALTDDEQTEDLHQSLSQLSIAQGTAVKQSQIDEMESDPDDERSVNEAIRTNKPAYLKTPDHVFVEMLSKTVEKG